MSYTIEFARAALQLGPLEVHCNVCGGQCALPQADPALESIGSRRHWLELGCGDIHQCVCAEARIASGIAAASDAVLFESALARFPLYDEAYQVVSCIERRTLAQKTSASFDIVRMPSRFTANDVVSRCLALRYAFDSISTWLDLRKSPLLANELLDFTFKYFHAAYCMRTYFFGTCDAGVARMRHIDPSLPGSAWVLATDASSADREIASVYLGVLCDEAAWARIERIHHDATVGWATIARTVGDPDGTIRDAFHSIADTHDALRQAADLIRKKRSHANVMSTVEEKR